MQCLSYFDQLSNPNSTLIDTVRFILNCLEDEPPLSLTAEKCLILIEDAAPDRHEIIERRFDRMSR